ncbi:thiol reductant ABC exporter subunit CydC [Microbacterium invictum]|uniref:Thiol reductant ABC exporter subunit CydC n=1 Tax=Microbacterium invictum TaxID=515415 RepID=A0ABZ0VEZ5_9MICO|nr:thiol reductant ABC exporter subunit CydC [Microbacterium invictum]WQB71417.1 thiol reductant ABC exporter subunit CydC [Microbacterium invictum]
MSQRDASTVRDILRSALPPARRLVPTILTGLAAEASAVALLAVSAWLIVRAAEQPAVLYLSLAVVGVRFFALSRATARYLERVFGHDAALGQLVRTRTGLVRRLVPLAPDGLSRTRSGSVLGALVDDVDELQDLPLRVIQPLASSALVAVLSVVLVGLVWWPAALTLLVCLALAAVTAAGWGWVAGARAERAVAPLRARVTEALMDHLSALDVLHAFGATEASRTRIDVADRALRRAIVRRAGAQAATTAVVSVAAGLASVAAVLVSAPAVATLTGPGLAVVVLVPMAVFEVFTVVPLAAAAWRRVHAAATRVAEAVPHTIPAELGSDTVLPTGTGPLLGAGLSLRGVSARWPGAASPALSGVDLDVAPGERVLVSGASGAGKTTLAHVLVRFLDADGDYTIGGVPVTALSADDVRRTVGLVEQHPMLFDDDIRQNLLFARPTASDAQLERTLERVGLAEWVRRRGGLDARVGERGAWVSGGQAQRLSLARALLRGFPVLILDEPTAGVDAAAADVLLRDLLAAVGPEQAVILISHADVPRSEVDRVVRLDAGTVVKASTVVPNAVTTPR